MLREFAILLFLKLDHSVGLPGKICKVPSAEAGTCMLLSKCDPLNELNNKRPKSLKEDAFFRQSVASCGRGSKLQVCCPPTSQWSKLVVKPVMYDEPAMSTSRTNAVPKPVNEGIGNRIQDPLPSPLTLNVPAQSDENQLQPELGVLDASENTETCGVDSNSGERIVGGNATDIDAYPWLALLEYEPKQFRCGGSLISRTYVLTAAHCLYTTPNKVRLSEYNITSEPTDEVQVYGGGTDSITVTIMELADTTQHPDHVYKTSIHDIGLIRLKEPVEYGDFIKPICLPTIDYRNTHFTMATTFTVAGWGSDNVYTNSEVKRSVFVPYVPMDTCSETYTELKDGQQMCAGGEEGKDSCRGDSGGPLMYEDSLNKNYVLVGIVSSGSEKCGTKGHPGVYTYVYPYVNWIKKTMDKN